MPRLAVVLCSAALACGASAPGAPAPAPAGEEAGAAPATPAAASPAVPAEGAPAAAVPVAEPEGDAVAGAAPDPSPAREAVYRALSVRSPAPSCEEVERLADDPVADLAYVVEHARQPPWAAMRAATCLVRGHAAEARPHLERWMREMRGVALLVADDIDALPEDVARAVARAGLDGPFADDLRPRLARSSRASVRALAGGG